MLYVRSLLFNIAFYVVTAILVFGCILTTPFPQRYTMAVGRYWGVVCSKVFVWIVGGSYEVRGLENLPQGESILLASKHMSVFETFALAPLVKNPLFILKRELLWIPFFGWAVANSEMIAIDRGSRQKALKNMLKQAKKRIVGRQLIIFPEGTRRPVDAEPHYKFGITHIYRSLKVPCYPVALNTGLFWPRRTFLRYPGKIIIEILPPIEAGLKGDDFFERVTTTIETNSQRLIAEAREDNPAL